MTGSGWKITEYFSIFSDYKVISSAELPRVFDREEEKCVGRPQSNWRVLAPAIYHNWAFYIV